MLNDRHAVSVDQIFRRVLSVEAPSIPELSFTRASFIVK